MREAKEQLLDEAAKRLESALDFASMLRADTSASSSASAVLAKIEADLIVIREIIKAELLSKAGSSHSLVKALDNLAYLIINYVTKILASTAICTLRSFIRSYEYRKNNKSTQDSSWAKTERISP